MQNKQKILSLGLLVTSVGLATQAQATLPTNAILKFNPAVLGGYYGTAIIGGSYFAMDTNGDGVFQNSERTGVTVNVGVSIGQAQPASGTHTGAPDGSEAPGIDNPWNFFGNTGLHQTTSPVTILSDNGAGAVTLDLSGWNVAWNGIASIPMSQGTSNGVATVTCATDCTDGDTYILDYFATVPPGDPSGFGNVPYSVHLEGDVTIPPILNAGDGSVGLGNIATAVGSVDGRISLDDLISNGGVADTDFTFGAGLADFVVTGISASTVSIVIPQTAPIPAGAVYRKFNNSAWTTFVSDGTNLIASAPSVASTCPSPNDTAYSHTNGLVEGDGCVQLTIEDDGPYDSDSSANNIADPGGVATPVVVVVDDRTSSTSGCSITGNSGSAIEHADWWLVSAFIGLLGWFGYRREQKAK